MSVKIASLALFCVSTKKKVVENYQVWLDFSLLVLSLQEKV